MSTFKRSISLEDVLENINTSKKIKLDIDVNELICPISKQIFYEPVKASDGQIYEKQAIKEWLTFNNTSPITRELLNKNLSDCRYIKSIINKLLVQYPEYKKLQYDSSIYCSFIHRGLRTYK